MATSARPAQHTAHGASVVRREGWGKQELCGPTHANTGFELTWVERGRLRLWLGRRWLEAPEGTCVLLPPGIEHTPRTAGVVMHQLTLPSPLVEEAAHALGRGVPRRERLFGAHDPITRLTSVAAAEAMAAERPGDPGLGALAEAASFVLVRGSGEPSPGTTSASTAPGDRRVQRAIERMRAEIAEPLRIEHLAREAGMDRWSFARLFRAQTGESARRYLTALRLEQAARMLEDRSASVLEIALSCGFPDPSRFASAFRARYGCAPRAFRERRR